MTLEQTVAEARAARLRGRVALVTGATGGIGRGVARQLAACGATVIVTSRDEARAVALADDLAAEGLTVVPAGLDVADPSDIERLVGRIVERYGRLDLLCNNAAMMHVEPILDLSLDTLAEVFRINVGGALACAQIVARQMQRQSPDPEPARGKIVNVSSPAADVPTAVEAAYGASKAALNQLTRTLATVLAPDLISVTALYPGNVWEGMQSQLHHIAGDPPGEPSGPSARAKLDGWPSGRWQRPDDTAAMVVYIGSFVGMGLNGDLVIAHPYRQRL